MIVRGVAGCEIEVLLVCSHVCIAIRVSLSLKFLLWEADAPVRLLCRTGQRRP